MMYPKQTTYEDLDRQVKGAETAYEALTDLIVELSPYWYDRRIAGKAEAEPGEDMRVLKETIDKLYIIRDTMTEKPLILKRHPVCWNPSLHSQTGRRDTEATKTEATKTEATKTEATKTEATETEAKEA